MTNYISNDKEIFDLQQRHAMESIHFYLTKITFPVTLLIFSHLLLP